MTRIIDNPYRSRGLVWPGAPDVNLIVTDATSVLGLLERCPAHGGTPLLDLPQLAERCGVARFSVKNEGGRMGLGSFKALGAAYAIAREAVERDVENPLDALAGRTYVAASAGNHGMSVAAGALIFGAKAVIFISETVSEEIAARLRGKGARVVREGADYEASMVAASRAAKENDWTLLSDSSWPGYVEPTRQVMAGYLALAAEIIEALEEEPTHIFLQAGVGGFSAALSGVFRNRWGTRPRIIVVEPEFAPCLVASIEAGAPVRADGPVSSMGRLDCKEPSHLALAGLARDADAFMTVSEEHVADTVRLLGREGVETTPSGAAGIAGALSVAADAIGLTVESRVLAIVTEGAG